MGVKHSKVSMIGKKLISHSRNIDDLRPNELQKNVHRSLHHMFNILERRA